jgi:uncharacterized protein
MRRMSMFVDYNTGEGGRRGPGAPLAAIVLAAAISGLVALPLTTVLSPAALARDASPEPADGDEAAGEASNEVDAPTDRPSAPVEMPLDPIEPGEAGFLLERLGDAPANTPVPERILLPPTAVAMPAELRETPSAAVAFGIFQRGYYLAALDMALPLAEEGDPAAQTLVAELFSEGFGVPRDFEQAAFWYAQAADGGNSTAQFKYGLMLISGRHATRDMARARELMEAAAEAGNAAAQFNYAQMLVNEMRGERGLVAALPYFEDAAAKGVPDAQYALSQIYMNVSDIEEEKRESARNWLARAAIAGIDTAQLDLAIWLVDGIGGARDYEQGFAWMERAARGGNVIAQNRLAHLYVHAIGTRPDPIEAGKWYVVSRRAGLDDRALQDFFRGLTDEEQRSSIEAANRFRS